MEQVTVLIERCKSVLFLAIQTTFVKVSSVFIFLLIALNINGQDYYITTEDLNLRSGAGKKYPSILVLEKGDTVELLESTTKYWVQIKGQGEIGFISKSYLQKIEIPKKIETESEEKVETESKMELSTLFIFLLILIIIAVILNKEGEKFRYKSAAVILSFILGIFGFQKFYLGERNKGIFSILFSWTYIPMLIGGVDFIRLLVMKEAKFNSLYNEGKSLEVKLSTQNDRIKPKIKTKTSLKKDTYSYQPKRNYVDDSIIDVNSENLDLSIEEDTKSEVFDREPPYWRHTYIYSFQDIQETNKAQKEYYLYFKSKVLKGEYVDLNGNTNYAFILYFDLINEYKNHRDIKLLDQLLSLLSEISPKTRSYSSSYVEEELKRIEEEYSIHNLTKLIKTIKPQQPKEAPEPRAKLEYYTPYDPDEHKLGAKYKSKLGLTKKEMAWLNKFYNPSNAFTSIEGCCIAIIRVYLAVFKELAINLKERETNIDKELNKIFDEVCKIERIRFSGYNTGYEKAWALRQFKESFFLVFFKTIENLVRERYGHKRKLSFKMYQSYPKSASFIDETIGNEIQALIVEKMGALIPPDLDTLIALNTQNVNRWKIEFDSLKNNFKKEEQETFVTAIIRLEETNQGNPNIENIFFEASKFIAKYNKVEALNNYAKYVYYDLKSKKINDKKLTKKVQKLLFNTKDQEVNFESIISDLKQTKDLEIALEKISKIYISKRKKIKFDRSEIQSIEQKHEGTVELLNEYLVDEKEEITPKVEDSLEAVVEIEVTSSSETPSIFISGIEMNPIQEELVRMIVDNSYELSQVVVERYAMEHGMFKNQLVDSINEACEDCLEGEVLIEEEDENYVIEEFYYKGIIKKEDGVKN